MSEQNWWAETREEGFYQKQIAKKKIKLKIFLEKKQNFECIFLKTRFFDFQTLKCRIAAIFRARKLNEVSLER